MVEQIFGALFLATLFVPAAVVVAGAVMLAWPRGKAAGRAILHHHAPARA
jgi:hypothetical protein